jgi:hypothetical protein
MDGRVKVTSEMRAAQLRLLTGLRADDHWVLPVSLPGGARPRRVSQERSARMWISVMLPAAKVSAMTEAGR